jgi:O-antigen ligase
MEVFIVLFGAALVVWGLVLLLRGGPLAGVLLFMLAASCLSNDFWNANAGAFKVTVDRVLWAAVMFLYLVWRKRGWTEPKAWARSDALAFAMVGYLGLRALTTTQLAPGPSPLVDVFIWWGMPLGVYWVVRQTRFSQYECNLVLISLIVFGVYLAVTVAAERFQFYAIVFPRYIVTSLTDKKLEFIGRGRGPLLHPMVTGIQLALCWSALLLTWTWKQRTNKPAVLGLSMLFGLAFYATMTRSVWMGAGLSFVVILGLAMPLRWRVAAACMATLCLTLVAATQWEEFVAFKRDKGLSEKETADSVQMRPIMAQIAWQMVCDRPVFGCGFDQYVPVHTWYLADRSTELNLEKARPYSPHNLLLGIVTETGLLGLGLFLAALVMWTLDAWRLWQNRAAPLWARQQGLLFLATLSAYMVNGMFHHIALVAMSNIMLFFMAGVVAALRKHAMSLLSRADSH